MVDIKINILRCTVSKIFKKKKTDIHPPVEFEPAIPASEWKQTQALVLAAAVLASRALLHPWGKNLVPTESVNGYRERYNKSKMDAKLND